MPRIRIRGLATAARKIEVLAREGGAANVSGLRVIAEEVATDVRASRPGRGVPRDEGILAASIHVTGPDSRGAVQIRAGGAAAPYALKQHEDLTLRHPLGEARYLVRGLERWQADGQSVRRALAENVEAAMQKAKRTT